MSTANQGQQETLTRTLCSAVTSTGGQAGKATDGYNGAQMVEVVAVGTVAAQAVTLQTEGSFDNTNWYVVGSQRVDGQATLTRAASGVTITPGNGTVRQVYQVLDAYPFLRINPTANTLAGTGAGLTAKLYAVPV